MNAPPTFESAARASISIRPVHAWEEYLAVEEIQRVVWQMPDWRDAVPANLLITAQKNGGLVLGAFDGDRLVGFAASFLGSEEAGGRVTLKHYSHMLAVLTEYQSRKIGLLLKLAQREAVRAANISLITWTFDPLQALNANLNLWRLGARVRRYLCDAYGEMTDGLNTGLASDRFQVDWWLDAPRVRECAEREPASLDVAALLRAGAREIFSTRFDPRGLPRIEQTRELAGETLIVEIPRQIAAVKTADAELARAWRTHTRDVFQRAFAAGYHADNFVYWERDGQRRAAYVLNRQLSF